METKCGPSVSGKLPTQPSVLQSLCLSLEIENPKLICSRAAFFFEPPAIHEEQTDINSI